MIKHVSFDLDGTLVDSSDVMRASWEVATRELGINCGFERFVGNVGLPFDKILANLGLSDFQSELAELYFAGTLARQHEIKKSAGVDDLLNDCRKRGLGLSVITSKPRGTAEPLLHALGMDVDVLICADDVAKGKPDPDSAHLVLNQFELRPADVLYVGDMVFDLQFALNAGFQFVFFENEGRNSLPVNLLNRIRRAATLAAVSDILA